MSIGFSILQILGLVSKNDMLKIGSKAPDFSLPNQDEKVISLSDFKGKKLIIFFYPADNTPTCTAEACNLSDNYTLLTKAGYAVIGVNADGIKKHQNFKKKYNFPFDLLADTESEMIKAYKVWGEKTMFGKKYMGIVRTTFVLDEEGKIARIIDTVKAKEHAQQILEHD
jgi:peroxiredoxin Q/BCP